MEVFSLGRNVDHTLRRHIEMIFELYGKCALQTLQGKSRILQE